MTEISSGAHRLIVMRHANAEPYSGVSDDFLRALSPRGRSDAEQAGQWLAAAGYIPESMLASPARRVRETVTLVGQGMGRAALAQDCVWDDTLYASSLDNLRDALVTHNRPGGVMLVGHNPGLEDFLRWLVPQQADVDPRFAPAGVVILDCSYPLHALEHGCATLVQRHSPQPG